jgi:hypothetical protein
LAADLARARMPPAVISGDVAIGSFGPGGGVQNNPLQTTSAKPFVFNGHVHLHSPSKKEMFL